MPYMDLQKSFNNTFLIGVINRTNDWNTYKPLLNP